MVKAAVVESSGKPTGTFHRTRSVRLSPAHTFRDSSAGPWHDHGKMKRALLLMAAVASLATAVAPPALAGDGGQGRRAERSDERGARERPPRRAEREGRDRRDDAPRRRYEDDRPRYEGPRRYDDGPRPTYMRPPGDGGRRGGAYLPDSYRGGVVDDYRRYRLRPPPQGYAWVRMGSGFALVEMDSGRVFDRVD